MIGVIGVAPAGESVPCGTPGDHGGNMDTIGIREGAILRLPVFVKGAYLGLGDLHAAMGDGEVSVTGSKFSVRWISIFHWRRAHPCPVRCCTTAMRFLSSPAPRPWTGRPCLDGYMHDFLLAKTSLNADEALMLMSSAAMPVFPRSSTPQDRPFRHARIQCLRSFGVVVE